VADGPNPNARTKALAHGPRRPLPAPRIRLVGRRAELAAIERAFVRASAGASGVVTGEPGGETPTPRRGDHGSGPPKMRISLDGRPYGRNWPGVVSGGPHPPHSARPQEET
jgi:hypothetical protein